MLNCPLTGSSILLEDFQVEKPKPETILTELTLTLSTPLHILDLFFLLGTQAWCV